MYGHPTAGRIAQKELIALLTKNDYYEDVPCLFFHKTRPISFTLVVDDLGIKTYNNDDITHLLSNIREKWKVKVDITGAKYNGTRLTWNYDQNTLVKDIPNYVEEALEKLGLRDIPTEHGSSISL